MKKYEITTLELKKLLDDGKRVFLLDVREAYEHERLNIGGTLIPLNQLRHRFRELDSEDEIIVYCMRGNRSAYAVNFLVQRGFKNVKNLVGGLKDWPQHEAPGSNSEGRLR
jgi:rhodanese-related sulfurtransferase